MSDIKVGDKVKSLVDYYDITKGDVLTVDSIRFGFVEATKDGTRMQVLHDDEYEKIEEAPPQLTIEQLLSKANEHAAEAAKHEKERQELIEKAKELLPEGWVLSEAGEVVESAEEDMSDPANWRIGDIVEFIDQDHWMTTGETYELLEWRNGEVLQEDGCVKVEDDEGDFRIAFDASEFEWISRPSKETK